MRLYPVNLNISGKLCIVVGGGGVALRKVKGLLAAGGIVRIISPQVHEVLHWLIREQELEWLQRNFAEGDLLGAFLVFAATSDQEVQKLIGADALKWKVMMNSADDPKGSQFHVPAHFRRGDVLVSVSTGGGSPALARRLRIKLEGLIGGEYRAVVSLMAAIRDRVVTSESDPVAGGALFNRLLDRNLVELVKDENWFELQMLLLQELPSEIDSVALLREFVQENEGID